MQNKDIVKMILTTSLVAMPALSQVVWAREDMCADDKTKFCSSVDSSDRKAMRACLTDHQADLSDACKQKLSKHGGKHQKVLENSPAKPDTSSQSGT